MGIFLKGYNEYNLPHISVHAQLPSVKRLVELSLKIYVIIFTEYSLGIAFQQILIWRNRRWNKPNGMFATGRSFAKGQSTINICLIESLRAQIHNSQCRLDNGTRVGWLIFACAYPHRPTHTSRHPGEPVTSGITHSPSAFAIFDWYAIDHSIKNLNNYWRQDFFS